MTDTQMKERLENVVSCYDLSGKIGGELAVSDAPLPVSGNLSGELRTYYQHLHIKEDAYFGNSFFNLILLSMKSVLRDPNYLGLDYFDKWQEKHYEIFAVNIAEDLIFCDVGEDACPVFGLISGSDEIIPLSESLHQFLDFYCQLTRLEAETFAKNIYQDEQFTPKPDFIQQVRALINRQTSDLVREGLTAFIL